MHEKARDAFVRAQLVIEEQANWHRTPQPAFGPGDFTSLSSYHLNTDRPCRKLREKFLVTFKILEHIGKMAYKLDIPASIAIHPVFPIKSLKPASCNPLHLQPQFHRPPSLVVKGQEEYEVKVILNSQHTASGTLEYKVRRVGYHTPTWESAKDVQRSKLLPAQYLAGNLG
jgi:hypothetical protein